MALERESVIDAVEQQAKALVSGDARCLEQLFDAELVWTHSSGKIDDKGSFLRPFADAPSRYKRFAPEITNLRLFEQVAVVHGVVSIASQAGDVVREFNNLFIAVWRRDESAWRLIAWQSTRQP